MAEDDPMPVEGSGPAISTATTVRSRGHASPRLAVLFGFFWLFPLFWIAGLAPLIPFVIVGVGVLETLASPRGVPYARYEIISVLLFLAGAGVGLFELGDPLRVLTWAHDVVVILAMMFVINAVRHARRAADITRLNRALKFFMAFAVAVGALGLILPGHLRYDTVVFDLLPKQLASTDYAKALFRIEIYTRGWFAHGEWRRVKGVSMFATSLAAMLCVWIVYVAGRERRNRTDWLMLGGALFILLTTLDRTSTVAAVSGIGVIAFLRSHKQARVLVFLFTAAILVGVMRLWSTSLMTSFHDFLVLRGGGSFYGRLRIYSATLRAIASNPWGHGSQHHVGNLGPPLGSHSTWLGVLYKFGVFGLASLVVYIFGTFARLRRGYILGERQHLAAGLGVLCAIALISVFEELYVDGTTALVMAAIVGIVLYSPVRPQPMSHMASQKARSEGSFENFALLRTR